MKKQIAFFVILFSLISFGQNIPKYSGYVNDFAGILSTEQKNSLEKEVRDFEKKTSTEIAVLIVKNLQGYEPVVFAQKTFTEWKIGKKGVDNGVLLLISIENRKARIHTGYGLEGCLPDAMTNKIQRKNLVPAFKAGMYFDGIKATVLAIMETVKNEKFNVADSEKTNKNTNGSSVTAILIIIGGIILICAIVIPLSINRRRKTKLFGEQNTHYSSNYSPEKSERDNYPAAFIATPIFNNSDDHHHFSHDDDSSSFSGGSSDSDSGYTSGSDFGGADFGGGCSGGGGSDSSW